MSNNRNKKICIVTTVGMTLDKLFPDFYPVLIDRGYSVVGICAHDKYVENVRRQGVKVIELNLKRDFAIFDDLLCLIKLYKIFKKEKFDVIHYSTPKASFLAAVAGYFARCPYLLYTLRGLGYESFTSIKYSIGKICDKIACLFADDIIAISPSLMDKAVKAKLCLPQKIHIVGQGSSKGVNLAVFNPDDILLNRAKELRKNYGLSDKDILIGYVGRLSSEKGIKELLNAFLILSKRFRNLHLAIIGSLDKRDPISNTVLELIKSNPNIHHQEFTSGIEKYMAALDILVLPSYREGFGNVLIEASALMKPVIGTNITGCRDALVDGVTGFLIEPHSVSSLCNKLDLLIKSPELRKKMGLNGYKWVKENFDRKKIWNMLLQFYEKKQPS